MSTSTISSIPRSYYSGYIGVNPYKNLDYKHLDFNNIDDRINRFNKIQKPKENFKIQNENEGNKNETKENIESKNTPLVTRNFYNQEKPYKIEPNYKIVEGTKKVVIPQNYNQKKPYKKVHKKIEEKKPRMKDQIVEGAKKVGEVALMPIAQIVDKIDQIRNNKKLKEKLGEIAFNCVDTLRDIDLESIFVPKPIQRKKKCNNMLNEKMLKILDIRNKNIILKKKLEEMDERKQKIIDEENRKKNLIIEGNKEWRIYKDAFRLNKLKEINYIDLIDETIINNYLEFKENIIKETEKIFNNNFKELSSVLIREKHFSIFQSIKNNIKEIQTLNFMMAGYTGAGKSSLTNAILKINDAKEGHGINPETDKIKQYSNKNEVPGITIYDTIGVETTSVDRNLLKIQKEIKEKFEEYLKDPQNSLHGIIYCIKNGFGDLKITKEEIYYIKKLNKLYGDGDILIITFTQSTNTKKITEDRKKQLREKLNNDNIEIINLLAKNYDLEIGDETIEIKAFGLDKLIDALKNKCKKQLVKYNIKQIAKKKIKEKYLENIEKKYKEIKKKLRKHKIESSLKYICKYILENLLGDLNLNFENMEKIIQDYTEKFKEKVMIFLKLENEERIMNRMKREFIIFNAKYDNLLKSSIVEYEICILNDKFKEYFEPQIKQEIENILFEKTLILFMDKSIEIISENVSQNVKDEEIEDLVNSNIDNLFKKF